MADSSLVVTPGSGQTFDTRTESTNGNHRGVSCIGDPSDNAGVAPVDGTAGLKVNLGADNDVTIGSALPAGTNAIGKLAANSGVDIGDVDVTTLPSNTFVAEGGSLGLGVLLQGDDGTDRKNINVDATTGDVQVDVTNTVTTNLDAAVSGSELQVDVVASLPAGTNNIGDVDIASALPAGTNNIGDVDIASALPAGTNTIGGVNVVPATSGGLSVDFQSALSNTAQTVKGSAGQVFGWYVYNPNTAVTYVQFFDAASVTVGTTTPKLSIGIPAESGANVEFTNGIDFSANSIKIAATTGATNATAPSTGLVTNIMYK